MLKTDVKDCALILFASFVFYQLFEGVILNQRTDCSFQSQPWVDDNKQFSKCKTNFHKKITFSLLFTEENIGSRELNKRLAGGIYNNLGKCGV